MRPQDQFRRWLEQQPAGRGQVPFDNLLRTWGVEQPGPRDVDRIQRDLDAVGISAQPPVGHLWPGATTTLWISQQAPAQQTVAHQTAAQRGPGAQARRTVPAANPIALVLIALGALLGVVATFLEWAAGASFWQLLEILDIGLLFFGLATIGVSLATLLARRAWPLRVALVPLAMNFGLPSLVLAFDFLLGEEGFEAGAALLAVGSLLATAGLVALLVSDFVRGQRPQGQRAVIPLVGLGGALLVAVLLTLSQLLPAIEIEGRSFNEWELATTTDIIDQLVVLAVLALAVAAAALRSLTPLTLGTGVLISYFALPEFLSGIEGLVNGGAFAGAFAAVVMGVIGLAVSLLLVTSAYPAGE